MEQFVNDFFDDELLEVSNNLKLPVLLETESSDDDNDMEHIYMLFGYF